MESVKPALLLVFPAQMEYVAHASMDTICRQTVNALKLDTSSMRMSRLPAILIAKPALIIVLVHVWHAINIEVILHRCLSVDIVIAGKVQLI